MNRAPSPDLFAQYPASWYLFGASRELARGPVSKTMLGRQLVAFRGKSGALAVMDARCSHMGADLGCGRIDGDAVVCPYHNWRYGADGICTSAPGVAQPPRFARQRAFPAVERHGYVFFFNGPEPLFPLPFFFGENADDYAAGRAFSYVADCPWFVNSAHAFDRQHFDAVHDRRLLAPPEIDCPAPFARRNRYRAEVLGRTPLDRVLRLGAGKPAAPVEDRKEQKRREAAERQARSNVRKDAQQLVHQLEKRINDLEARQSQITAELEKPETYGNGGNASILNREMRQNETELTRLTPEWETAAAKLAEIDAKE